MNKELFQVRMMQIAAEIETTKNQHVALMTRLSECEFWLAELLKAEPEVEPILIAQDEE